jgi:hypothetical protein
VQERTAAGTGRQRVPRERIDAAEVGHYLRAIID